MTDTFAAGAATAPATEEADETGATTRAVCAHAGQGASTTTNETTRDIAERSARDFIESDVSTQQPLTLLNLVPLGGGNRTTFAVGPSTLDGGS